MHPWRDPTRPTRWTKEGKLVYTNHPNSDPVMLELRTTLRGLIAGPMVDGVTHGALADVCRAMTKRQEELEHGLVEFPTI